MYSLLLLLGGLCCNTLNSIAIQKNVAEENKVKYIYIIPSAHNVLSSNNQIIPLSKIHSF